MTAGTVLVQIDSGDLTLEIDQIQNDYETAKKRIAVGSSIKLDLEMRLKRSRIIERLTKTGQLSRFRTRETGAPVKQIEQKLALENCHECATARDFRKHAEGQTTANWRK